MGAPNSLIHVSESPVGSFYRVGRGCANLAALLRGAALDTGPRHAPALVYLTTHQGAALITPSFLHFYPFLLFYRSNHWHTVVAVRSKNRSECCYFNLLWPPLLQTFYFNFPLSQLHGWLGPGREWCPPPCMCSTNRKCYTQEMEWLVSPRLDWGQSAAE